MNNKIKISIIIPSFNRSEYIKTAIQSALNQDYENIEIIISDNASAEDTWAIINSFITNPKIRCYRNETNIGMVNNWKKCLYEYASGDYFLILSDDDLLIDPCYISKAVSLINTNEHISIVFADGYILNETKNKKKPLKLPFPTIVDGKKVFLDRPNISPQAYTLCNVIFNRKLAIEHNAFSNENNICCDSELFLFLCLCGKIGVIHDFVSIYRIHGNNLLTKIDTNYLYALAHLDTFINPHIYGLKNKIFSIEETEAFMDDCIFEVFDLVIYSIRKLDRKERIHILTELKNKYGNYINYYSKNNLLRKLNIITIIKFSSINSVVFKLINIKRISRKAFKKLMYKKLQFEEN